MHAAGRRYPCRPRCAASRPKSIRRVFFSDATTSHASWALAARPRARRQSIGDTRRRAGATDETSSAGSAPRPPAGYGVSSVVKTPSSCVARNPCASSSAARAGRRRPLGKLPASLPCKRARSGVWTGAALPRSTLAVGRSWCQRRLGPSQRHFGQRAEKPGCVRTANCSISNPGRGPHCGRRSGK